MNVRFARPSVSNLMFCLFGRSVHPELFDVYAETILQKDQYTAVVRICEAGHTVEFRGGRNVLTEVATTVQQPLPQQRRLLEKKLRGQREESVEFNGGLRYQVSYQLEQLDPEVFLNFNEELLIDSTRAEIAHRFPTGNRLDPGPLSLIRIDACTHSLLIHAYHTFPESSAVVKTQSLFEL